MPKLARMSHPVTPCRGHRDQMQRGNTAKIEMWQRCRSSSGQVTTVKHHAKNARRTRAAKSGQSELAFGPQRVVASMRVQPNLHIWGGIEISVVN